MHDLQVKPFQRQGKWSLCPFMSVYGSRRRQLHVPEIIPGATVRKKR